jgi:hypothetical protein
VFCVNVTALLAVSDVNAPVFLVVAPILILLIVPAVAGFRVNDPVPVGAIDIEKFAGLKFAAPALTFSVPPTVTLFRILVVPVVAPILIVDAV